VLRRVCEGMTSPIPAVSFEGLSDLRLLSWPYRRIGEARDKCDSWSLPSLKDRLISYA
jgi:hypothetical protein